MPIGGSRYGGTRYGGGSGRKSSDIPASSAGGGSRVSTSIIEELDHLMALDDVGIALYIDEDALNERLREWFETPVGSVADLPACGHPLSVLKFEPAGVNLDTMAEMLIIEKLPRDIANLQPRSITVHFTEIDLLTVSIQHSLGVFEENIYL